MKWLLIILFFLSSCKQKENMFTLDPSIYNERVEILFLPREEMQLMDTTIDFDGVDALTYCMEGNILVWFPDKNVKKEVLNHELFHVTSCIMMWVGIPLTRDTNEAYAYLFGYLTKEFYEIR